MRALSTIMKRSRWKAASARLWGNGFQFPLTSSCCAPVQSRKGEIICEVCLWSDGQHHHSTCWILVLSSLCVGFSWGHPSDHSCELGCLWLSPRQIAILWCIFFVRLPRGSVMWSLLACSSSYQQCSFVVETRWHSYIACGYIVTCHVGRYSLSSSEDQQRFKQCQLTPKSVTSMKKGCNAIYR